MIGVQAFSIFALETNVLLPWSLENGPNKILRLVVFSVEPNHAAPLFGVAGPNDATVLKGLGFCHDPGEKGLIAEKFGHAVTISSKNSERALKAAKIIGPEG